VLERRRLVVVWTIREEIKTWNPRESCVWFGRVSGIALNSLLFG